MSVIHFLAAASLAVAHQAAPEADEYAKYVVYSAAFASTVSYCRARHGEMQLPASKRCFNRARDTLSTDDLDAAAAKISANCRDPATRQNCLIPELGPLVEQITRRFSAQGI